MTKNKKQYRRMLEVPTEVCLNGQVSDHLQAIAKPCSIWVAPIVGGIAVEKQERFLRNKPEIIVATPGRLWELMRDGADFLTNMDNLSFLVLDEADRMVQQGHYEVHLQFISALILCVSVVQRWNPNCISPKQWAESSNHHFADMRQAHVQKAIQ